MATWHWLVERVTWERLLTKRHKANGGAVIAARALHTTVILSVGFLVLFNLFECVLGVRQLGFIPSWAVLKCQLDWGMPYIVGGFGATYAGFYARFSSQWTYLAGTYNQIKRAECAKEWNKKALAQWKAGYIEDAETLHLTTKSSVAPTIWVWLNNRDVAQEFEANTPLGKKLRPEILERVKVAIRREIAERWDEAAAAAWEAEEARKQSESAARKRLLR